MMLPFFILLAVGAIYIIGLMLLRNSQELIILWGQDYTVETSSFTVMLALFFGVLAIGLGVWLLYWLVTLPKRLAQQKQLRRRMLSQAGLKRGMVKLLEGHWAEGEKSLLKHVEYSDNPMLNYLAAARAAQMQENYQQRDEYLKKASSFGSDAQIAVAASQATMQFDTGQTEQARATLTHLREISPDHPFPNRLLAKVYYQQEDWKQLVDLIPDLDKSSDDPSQKHRLQAYLQRAVEGLFEITSGKQDLKALESIWNQLPDSAKQENYAIEAYANALNHAGDGESAAALLEERLDIVGDRQLFKLYGQISHRHPQASLKKAKQWESKAGNDPALILCLARLEKQ